jgi:hypothetical protein
MSFGLTFCKAAVVSDAQPLEVAAVEVQSRGSYRRVGVAVVIMAAVALVGAFIPLSTIAAGVLAILGLVLGVGCLIRDPGFNLPALVGTLLSSAAVSAAVIMMFVYA